MKITIEMLRPLLPTLQHLARFPLCNWDAICRRDGVSRVDVNDIVQTTCGSLSLWDEEYLEQLCKRVGVPVPSYPEMRTRSAPVAFVGAKESVSVVTAKSPVIPAGALCITPENPQPTAAEVAHSGIKVGRKARPRTAAVARADDVAAPGDLLEQVNQLLATFRVEAVAVRIVPRATDEAKRNQPV